MRNFHNKFLHIITFLTILALLGVICSSAYASGTGNSITIHSVSKLDQSGVVDIFGSFKNNTNAQPLFNKNNVSFVYVGGLFCPYCAMERWAIVMALEQFGNFSNLGQIISSEDSVPSYSFNGSTYTSNLVNFQPAEIYDNNYNQFEQMNNFQKTIFNEYNTGGIPFICIGGAIFRTGAGPSFNLNSFSNQAFNTVKSQVDAKNGSFYDQIATDSNYIVQIIHDVMNYNFSSITSSTSLSLISSYHLNSSTTTPAFGVILFFSSIIFVILIRSKRKQKF